MTYAPTKAGQHAIELGKHEGLEAIVRVAPLLLPMNQEERILFFSSFLARATGHMKAAVGHDATRAIVDALKQVADGDAAAPGKQPTE